MNVTYDSRNRVVRRTSPNGTLNLTYSGWNLIEERNGGGELEQTYVHGAGVDEMLVKVSSSGPAYYHHDGLGSTIALTGENGELLESYRYDAFGGVSVMNATGLSLPVSGFQNRFLFTGREHLSSVSLYDYRNRVYSASLGRFLQTDPTRFEAGDVNLYRYVGNGPVNVVDPLGLLQVTVYGGSFIGGYFTIGLNGGTGLLGLKGGQVNIGIAGGIGGGLGVSVDLHDSGRRPCGFGGMAVLAGGLGTGTFGIGGEVDGFTNQDASISLGGRATFFAGGVNAGARRGSETFSYGGSNYGAAGFAGGGFTWTSK